MSFKKEVIDRLGKIEQNMVINNQILAEHHRRSTNLEERVKPLEDSHIFFNKFAKIMAGIFSIVVGLAATYHYLFK